jgi:hypothetical protein
MGFCFFRIVPEIGIQGLLFFVGYLGFFASDVKDTSSKPRHGLLYLYAVQRSRLQR